MNTRALRSLLTALIAIAVGCSEGSPTSQSDSAISKTDPSASAGSGAGSLVAEGRETYLGNCIACHNANPKLEGPLGPPVAGASEPLLDARILHGTYPPGYKPKRSTSAMVPMPFLKNKIPALAAFLAQAK